MASSLLWGRSMVEMRSHFHFLRWSWRKGGGLLNFRGTGDSALWCQLFYNFKHSLVNKLPYLLVLGAFDATMGSSQSYLNLLVLTLSSRRQPVTQ